MNPRNVKILAAVVLILFGTLFALNSADRSDSPAGTEMLFPELKPRLNDLNEVTITDADGTLTLRRAPDGESDGWVSSEHDGYPADTAKLRQLLLAIADAQKLERKTSDPALYGRLGVADPAEEDGGGVLVSAKGDDAAVSVILGDPAQGNFRYARLPEEEQSWLINRNPGLPDDSAGWLVPEIVDIDASRIESVVIRHADGEEIRIRKGTADDVNYDVENIPDDRELRYPSVANGIAGVLADLTLQDVSSGDRTGEDASVAEFRTFDGLELQVRIGRTGEAAGTGEEDASRAAEEEEYWITLEASASEASAGAPQPTPETAADDAESEGGEPATEQGGASGNDGETGAAAADAGQAGEDRPDPAEEAAGINQRVGGWSYRIAGYKADQLTRRLEDLLSEEEDAASEQDR